MFALVSDNIEIQPEIPAVLVKDAKFIMLQCAMIILHKIIMIYYLIVSIVEVEQAVVSFRNRVLFTVFLHFENIPEILVRHSEIIHIRGIRQQKILCITSLFSSRLPVFYNNFFFFFSWCYLFRRVIKVVLYYSHDVITSDHILMNLFYFK